LPINGVCEAEFSREPLLHNSIPSPQKTPQWPGYQSRTLLLGCISEINDVNGVVLLNTLFKAGISWKCSKIKIKNKYRD